MRLGQKLVSLETNQFVMGGGMTLFPLNKL